ncbi:hypothetical protein I350_07805 [Cryptococcus amylolentus CBS 6273]|uniref:DUF788-domain-containing protein n=1 Tax=Cryptococcus amylolentus CBS 6273 TaxID=1296118 RepID=A0A1E3JBA7_9TREE|nr:hypothetical protein I350_07805 [Cryptococcus amylolentus CBS 6273]
MSKTSTANASSKRIASGNESALRNLQNGLLLVNGSAWILRFLLSLITSRSLFPRIFPLILYILSTTATVFIWRWFVTIGSPKRGANGRGDVRVGDDLAGKGVVELAWDWVYMTWICTIGSALFGDRVWWLLALVPAFGAYKLFNTIRPFLAMFLPSLFGPKSPRAAQEAAQEPEEKESRKQAKLRARMEKGDKRVQQVQRR